MNIFEYHDYKLFVLKWVKNNPQNGRGILKQMAESAQTSSTIISLVFHGDRDLTLEQAQGISQFMNLDSLETDYFMCLVMHQRAGTIELKKYFDNKLKSIKRGQENLKTRLNYDGKLNENEEAQFYSHWTYSGVWNLIACVSLAA